MHYILIAVCIFFSSWLSANSSVVRVVATEQKLLQYQENGETKGPSVEIYNMLMAESRLSFDVEFMPWARAYKLASSRANTIIFSIVKTEERENKFHWIIPVSKTWKTFIAHSTKVDPEQYTLAHIKNKVSVVERDTFSYYLLMNEGFIEGKNLYVVSSQSAALNVFFDKKVDFIFTDPSVVESKLPSYGLTTDDLVVTSVLKNRAKTAYIAINKDSDDMLVTILKDSAKKVVKTKTYKTLSHLEEQ